MGSTYLVNIHYVLPIQQSFYPIFSFTFHLVTDKGYQLTTRNGLKTVIFKGESGGHILPEPVLNFETK